MRRAWVLLVAQMACRFEPHASDAAGQLDAANDVQADASIDAGIDPVTIQLVQVCSNVLFTTDTTVNCVLSGAQGIGHTNIVVVDWYGAASLTSLADTTGNVYVLTGLSATASAFEAMYYAPNIAASVGGANVLTVSTSAAVNNLKVRILEYAGLQPASPFESG